MRLIIPFTILMLFAFTSCKSKKSTATASANTTQQQTSASQPKNDENTMRLTASFYSIGSGIDWKVNDEFVKFLDSYPQKIAYEPIHWGREGEIDYCLKLTGLSTSEQNDFVKKAKEILSNSSFVHVNENAQCVHKH